MDYRFFQASKSDIDNIANLIHKMNIHYFKEKAPGRTTTQKYVSSNFFAEHSGIKTVLVTTKNEAIAIATYSILYPAPGKGGQLFLKDLFTIEEFRGMGIGKKLLRHIAQIAIDHNCHRFDWTAETTNPKAIEFYERLGAEKVKEKVYFRFSGEELKNFAAE